MDFIVSLQPHELSIGNPEDPLMVSEWIVVDSGLMYSIFRVW